MSSAAGEWIGSLRRRVAVLLVVKLAALTLLWGLFFSPSHRPAQDAEAVAAQLMPAASPSHRSTRNE